MGCKDSRFRAETLKENIMKRRCGGSSGGGDDAAFPERVPCGSNLHSDPRDTGENIVVR